MGNVHDELTTQQRRMAVREGWLDRIVTRSDVVAVQEGCYYDDTKGQHAVGFIEHYLFHTTGRKWKGKRFLLMAWQKRFIENIFGWLRSDGMRRFRTVYLTVAKKNGKSCMAAAIALYLLIMDGEPAAEVYCAAATRNQARIVHGHCEKMTVASPELARRLEPIPSKSRIIHRESGSFIQAISSEAGLQEGYDIHGVVVDELHIHKKADLIDTLAYGGDAREQSMMVIITTAGLYDTDSVGWAYYESAKNIIEGVTVDPTFYAEIYEVPKDKEGKTDIDDESLWILANPSLGEIIKVEDFRNSVRSAKNDPRLMHRLLRYKFNQYVEVLSRYFDLDAWSKLDDTLTLKDFEGLTIALGLDLSSTEDMTAITLVARDADGVVLIYPIYFLPRVAIKKANAATQTLYSNWIRDGHLIITENPTVDYSVVRAAIYHLKDLREEPEYKDDELGLDIARIAADPHNATETLNILSVLGYDVVTLSQTYRYLNSPTKELKALIGSGDVRHNGNPILTFNIGNATVKEDDRENVMLAKPSRSAKIDGAAAGINALQFILKDDFEPESAYATRGVLSFHG